MTDVDGVALFVAVQMIQHGIPVFICKPDPNERDGFRKPNGWQHTQADMTTLSGYRPGDALCMLCGHGLDVIDVDVQNGGDKHRGSLDEAGLVPTIYGRARTPSGGTHEYVRTLGVRKQQDVWPGIDVQAGDEHGEGRGFVYIAPTIKKSKTTGEMNSYVWELPIDWEMFENEQGETSGEALAGHILSIQTSNISWEPYEGDPYDLFDADKKRQVDSYVDAALRGVAEDLQKAGRLGPGERDPRGAGWEKITADAAFKLARLVLAPWNTVTADQAWRILKANAPTDGDWTEFDVEQKFRSQKRLAEKKPMPNPVLSLTDLAGPDGAALPPLSAEVQRDFWERRDYLSTIRAFAYARMCSPWAVLGVVLCRALCIVPPHVMLPATVGGRTSLNLYVALVGPPGAGKDAAMAVGEDVFPGPVGNFDEIHVERVGSGEGIAHTYMKRADAADPNTGIRKGDLIQIRNSALFQVPEIDTLLKLDQRNGSTLMPTLREAFGAADISFGYADKAKRLPMPKGKYRMCLVMGVQPSHARQVLEDESGGFPQRVLWFPATDPDISADRPAVPPALEPPPGSLWAGTVREREMSLPPEVEQEVVEQRAAHASKDITAGADIRGHWPLMRQKVSGALAALDGRNTISLEDWELSGLIMRKSDETLQRIREVISKDAQKATERAGKALGHQQAVSEEAADERRLIRIRRLLLNRLRQDGSMSSSSLRRALASRDRHLYEDAIGQLLSMGEVTRQSGTGQYVAAS